MNLFNKLIDWLAIRLILDIDFPKDLDKLNPADFTTKEIASIMKWSERKTQWMINTGIRQGLFIKTQEEHYSTVPKEKDDDY